MNKCQWIFTLKMSFTNSIFLEVGCIVVLSSYIKNWKCPKLRLVCMAQSRFLNSRIWCFPFFILSMSYHQCQMSWACRSTRHTRIIVYDRHFCLWRSRFYHSTNTWFIILNCPARIWGRGWKVHVVVLSTYTNLVDATTARYAWTNHGLLLTLAHKRVETTTSQCDVVACINFCAHFPLVQPQALLDRHHADLVVPCPIYAII